MKLYVIWNYKENRPAVAVGNYGSLVVYLTKEQAQAYLSELGNEELIFKEMELK